MRKSWVPDYLVFFSLFSLPLFPNRVEDIAKMIDERLSDIPEEEFTRGTDGGSTSTTVVAPAKSPRNSLGKKSEWNLEVRFRICRIQLFIN